ncbi:hypothetical protein CERSUDRAFT_115780 [Gelatoporia subvermispora B]|uniref:Sodium/calcium exchanger membrane region domain-containing protein n=1 Tax=Ceriporiopsis subvermispora (strain B) TaxID=914234 RepID=M2RBS9_CERS8|nr:hypothetical protein CERSUDRAFT_115780 [Gelatoporia subvermispora B]
MAIPLSEVSTEVPTPDIEKGATKVATQEKRLFYRGHNHRVKRFMAAVKNRNGARPQFKWRESFYGAITSSGINILLLVIPLAWVSHFHHAWGHKVTFALCFLSIIPLERMFDWGGEQMAYYLGEELGDLLIVTLNNAVEATLAIILLAHCELRLLQSTIVGVIVLHLLLVPGTSFLTGGMQSWQQELTEHTTELNHSLLMLGVMAIMLPTALFAALDRGASASNAGEPFSSLINDQTRDQILQISRGLSVILLVVYICSRVFIHTSDPDCEEDNKRKRQTTSDNPETRRDSYGSLDRAETMTSQRKASSSPVPDMARLPAEDETEAHAAHIKGKKALAWEKKEKELLEELRMGPGAGFILLVVTVGVMAATAEFLVESIEFVREEGNIEEEWFGLILLPIVSFAGDGTVAIVRFIESILMHLLGRKLREPKEIAQARAIDLSIQFVLWWMPLLVLLGWWIGKPMHLMFDYFELALLLGSCFLVNYVTADSQTNWVEGLIMMAFYLMIAICAWFYVGQPESAIMLTCGSVAQAVAGGAAEGSG